MGSVFDVSPKSPSSKLLHVEHSQSSPLRHFKKPDFTESPWRDQMLSQINDLFRHPDPNIHFFEIRLFFVIIPNLMRAISVLLRLAH
jgi:hypothetical protein